MHFFCTLLCILCFSFSFAAPTLADTLLGQKSIKTQPTSQLPRWEEILNNQVSDVYNAPSGQVKSWIKFIESLKGEPKLRQMMKVNLWFKKFAYKQDSWIYGEDDYWASPVEFLTKGGDCEDYAIIKYVTLRQLGFQPKDMKIAMVYDVYSGTDHAFLTVQHNDAEFVLDNREKLTVSRYMQNRYKPHFSFNEKNIWIYNSPVIVQKMRAKKDGSILAGNR